MISVIEAFLVVVLTILVVHRHIKGWREDTKCKDALTEKLRAYLRELDKPHDIN